jgi:hypothetical protein
MKGEIIADWSRFNAGDPTHQKKFIGALQHYMLEPARNPKLQEAMHHLATIGDFPSIPDSVIARFMQEAHYDETYKEIFDIRDFTGSKVSSFSIVDVADGLTFNKHTAGEECKVYKVSGDKVVVTFDRFGGALGFDREMLDDNIYWALEDAAKIFRNKAYYKRAFDFYALIEAVPATRNVAWQAPVPPLLANTDPNYSAIRDMETINQAAFQIVTSLATTGLGVSPTTELIILAPLALKSRIDRALGLLNAGLAGAQFTGARYNFTVRYTQMLTSNTVYYVIAPKRKAKGGIRMDLTIEAENDILKYTHTIAGWQRYGGAIAQTLQFRRCATA